MDFTASIQSTATNFNDPTTFIMIVQFTDPNGSSSTKEYIVPVSNQVADNQALIQADLTAYEASYNASAQAVTDLSTISNSAISLAPELSATLQTAESESGEHSSLA